MPAACRGLLGIARVAHDQSSFDQARSIVVAASRLAKTELGDDEFTVFEDEARQMLALIDHARQDRSRPLHIVISGDSLTLPRPENLPRSTRAIRRSCIPRSPSRIRR